MVSLTPAAIAISTGWLMAMASSSTRAWITFASRGTGGVMSAGSGIGAPMLRNTSWPPATPREAQAVETAEERVAERHVAVDAHALGHVGAEQLGELQELRVGARRG